MVTESETRVIDPEFAFYGPMGFDLGAVIGNLIMSYLASVGHERTPGERQAFESLGTGNDRKRLESSLPTNSSRSGAIRPAGDAYPAALFAGPSGAARLEAERQIYMERLFQDAVGFARPRKSSAVSSASRTISISS